MKNLVITTALSLLFSVSTIAQQKSVEERASEKVANLDKELTLSEQQKAQLKTYFVAELNQMAETKEERTQARQEMKQKRANMQTERQEMRERRATQKENMVQKRDSRMERMKEILTEEQYEKWLSTRKEQRENMQRNRGNRSQMNSSSTDEGQGNKKRNKIRGNRN